ncbi:MAG: DUF3592 domain-containing protein [Ignavibacteria bacterium]|jgi:hypothetical protein|nr:DUF3592 domain-containing protein [Ignavibacteria bacterium]
MLGFGKKKDPKEALEDADKAVNKGISGFMTKTFLGKDFVDQANKGIDMAKQYTQGSNLMQTGLPATAEVLGIADTGALINYNPVVKLKLKVTPQYGVPFDADIETMVSKIAVPRVGDTINVKYNPANQNEMIVV